MKAKKVLALLLVVILMTGVCGCMQKQNDDAKMENMKSYAVDKYGRSFTVEGFYGAKDDTYTNILALSDGECIFNVYQSGKTDATDDYPKAIANKKLLSCLQENTDCAYEIYANFILTSGNNMTLEYAQENEVPVILKDYPLMKAVVVVVVNKSISECAEELFSVYQEVMALNPKYIDFEVIQSNGVSSDLSDMLHNLSALYDSNWKKHTEVVASLSVTDTSIRSSDELIRGIKGSK